jgi:hypothetical protein
MYRKTVSLILVEKFTHGTEMFQQHWTFDHEKIFSTLDFWMYQLKSIPSSSLFSFAALRK